MSKEHAYSEHMARPSRGDREMLCESEKGENVKEQDQMTNEKALGKNSEPKRKLENTAAESAE